MSYLTIAMMMAARAMMIMIRSIVISNVIHITANTNLFFPNANDGKGDPAEKRLVSTAYYLLKIHP